jgi:CheY-like chemotaxis protein
MLNNISCSFCVFPALSERSFIVRLTLPLVQKREQRRQLKKQLALIYALFASISRGEADSSERPQTITCFKITAKEQYEVLVVDDDDNFRESFVQTLNDLTDIDVFVKEVESGREAIDELKNNPDRFDLVFLDLILPDINGCAIFDTLKSAGFNQPIVMMSSELNSREAQLAKHKKLEVYDKGQLYKEVRSLFSNLAGDGK